MHVNGAFIILEQNIEWWLIGANQLRLYQQCLEFTCQGLSLDRDSSLYQLGGAFWQALDERVAVEPLLETFSLTDVENVFAAV